MIGSAKGSLMYWLLFFILMSFSSPAMGYEEVVVANGGRVGGFVKVEGKVVKGGYLEVTKNREVCGKVVDESLVVGVGQGVRYAVVTLEGVSKGKVVEREVAHELDNAKCRFIPHVQAASVGQFLMMKNSDPILHTVHAYTPDGQPQFNVGLYPGRVSRKALVSAGVIKILCEAHPWMRAYVAVSEHPYYAVTDLYGEYQITDIPAGSYRLKVWHESLGGEEKRGEGKGGAGSKMDFMLLTSQGAKKR